MSKLKYKPGDFADSHASIRKPLTCQVTEEEYFAIKASAEYLGTDVSKLMYRCLSDAGVFGETAKAKNRKNMDSQPDPAPASEESNSVPDELPC